MTSLETVFTAAYRYNLVHEPETPSGRGSTLARTTAVRGALPGLLDRLGARTLLDAPCGDFHWMRHVPLVQRYIGVDVVAELVERNGRLYGAPGREFRLLDLTADRLPTADVILCRDCLIHLSLADAAAAIRNFRSSGAAFLLATTHTTVRENTDIPSGNWRSLNLLLPPFDFPPPIQVILEDAELGKCLGLWRPGDLPGPRHDICQI